MSRPTSWATLVRLRRAVVAGDMTSAEAAASVGIPRGTLASRWRAWGIVEMMPTGPRHTTRRAVAAVIADDASLSDAEISERLAADGVRLNTSCVRGHRVSLGIGTQRQRMEAADPAWRHPTWRPKKVTDDELRESRRRVVARETSVRRVAAELKISTTSLYDGWKRLGLVQERPSGFAADTQRRCNQHAPIRAEVAAHLRDYPWMTASDIADSMTADGYPITKRAVYHHLKALRMQAAI